MARSVSLEVRGLRKIRNITAVCLLTGLVLSGCGRQSQITYESTRMETMAEDMQENSQAVPLRRICAW